MKNYLLITFVYVCAFAVSSCGFIEDPVESQEGNVQLQEQSIRQGLIQQDLGDAIEAYQGLLAEEKVSVWQEKLVETMAMEQWNNPQLEFIELTRQALSAELFLKNHSLESEVEMMTSTLEYFSESEMAKIFMSIYPYGETGPGEVLSGPIRGCSCRWSSFCGWDWECIDNGCTHTVEGCGFLWMYSCLGACGESNTIH